MNKSKKNHPMDMDRHVSPDEAVEEEREEEFDEE
jgi:hypothetical protein